jgi:hypothetical protein
VSAGGLSDIAQFTVTRAVLSGTLNVVRAAGAEGHEAFVLWGGVRDPADPAVLHLRSAVRPWQRPQKTARGLLVTVPGKALFSANKLLYERGEVLAAQAHSHPTDAFHSSTDDDYPLVTLLGGLSVVIPDFGRDGLEAFGRWAWYRLEGTGRWNEISARDCLAVIR